MEPFRFALRLLLALSLALLLAATPVYRGGVLPDDRSSLLAAAAIPSVLTLLLAGAEWLAGRRAGMRRRNAGGGTGLLAALWLAAALGYGWLAALHPRGVTHEPTGAIYFFEDQWPPGFGTVHQPASLAAMHLCSIAAAIFAGTWICARRETGRRLVRAGVAAGGTLAAAAGAAQQLGLAAPEIWGVERVPGNVFGFFWYHANAASFLLLTLPVTAWAFQSCMRPGGSQLGRVLLLSGMAAQTGGLLMNYSKAGHMLLAAQAVAACLYVTVRWRQRSRRAGGVWQRSTLIAAPLALLIGALAWLNGAAVVERRWDDFAARGYRDEGRARAAALTWRMAADAPFGWGPGAFEAVFPHYSKTDPDLSRNRWKHAHHDYGQFAAEWGYCGGLILAAGLAGALWLALRGGRRGGRKGGAAAGLFYCGLALTAVMAHAWVDFPMQNPVILLMTAAVAGLWLASADGTTRTVGILDRRGAEG